jgi:thiol-disulfide isomerase/thioredoxin
VTDRSSARGNLYGPLLVGVSVLALIFLPSVLHKRDFSLVLSPKDAPGNFPLDLELPMISRSGGKRISTTLRKLMGKTRASVIVNFWASWCPPCVEELPSLEYLNRQLTGLGSNFPIFVGVTVDESIKDVFSLYQTLDFKPTFISLHDQQGELARSVGTSKFPETYWVANDGHIIYKWIGPQDWLSADVIRKISAE